MTAAARQKRRRTREALGLAVYGVEVGGGVLTGLEMAGLLREHEMTDRDAVSAALAKALVDWSQAKLASRVTAIALGRRYDPRRKDQA